jgi:hypothetical protein
MAQAANLSVEARNPAQSFPGVSLETLAEYAADRLAAARAYPKGRLHRRDFSLARLDMTVWFSSPLLAALCDRALALRTGDDPSAGCAEIFALDAGLDGWAPPGVWRGPPFAFRDFERILAADGRRGFHHGETSSWQFYERSTGVGVQTLASDLGLPPWEFGSPLRLFLHWAYASAGMRLTHAGTLGVDGVGVMIVGPSGSGKSGTTLAGLLHGLDSVGDDYVLVETGPRIVARPVFKLVKQDKKGLRRAGVAPKLFEGAGLNWHGKVELDVATFARPYAEEMELRAVFLPEIAHAGRTSFTPASARDSARALAPSGVLQLPGDMAEGFQFLSGLARRLPAFVVRLSEDPVEIADAIASFISREL